MKKTLFYGKRCFQNREIQLEPARAHNNILRVYVITTDNVKKKKKTLAIASNENNGNGSQNETLEVYCSARHVYKGHRRGSQLFTYINVHAMMV